MAASLRAVLNLIRNRHPVKIDYLADEYGATPTTMRKYVAELRDCGFIVVSGSGVITVPEQSRTTSLVQLEHSILNFIVDGAKAGRYQSKNVTAEISDYFEITRGYVNHYLERLELRKLITVEWGYLRRPVTEVRLGDLAVAASQQKPVKARSQRRPYPYPVPGKTHPKAEAWQFQLPTSEERVDTFSRQLSEARQFPQPSAEEPQQETKGSLPVPPLMDVKVSVQFDGGDQKILNFTSFEAAHSWVGEQSKTGAIKGVLYETSPMDLFSRVVGSEVANELRLLGAQIYEDGDHLTVVYDRTYDGGEDPWDDIGSQNLAAMLATHPENGKTFGYSMRVNTTILLAPIDG